MLPDDARDTEPNDGPASAMPLALGVPTRGYIDPPPASDQGDADWYVVTVTGDEPVQLSASLSGADDLDVVLEWMNPGLGSARSRAIVRADVVRKQPGPEMLAALRVPPGKAYFRVRGAWYRGKERRASDRPYTLLVTHKPLRPGTDAEPNDRRRDAIRMAFDEMGWGTIGHVGDGDVWAYDLTESLAGRRLRVDLTAPPELELSLSVGLDTHKAALREAPTAGSETLSLRGLYVPAGAQTLFAVVKGRRGRAGAELYSIRASVEPETPDEVAEHEPNGRARIATHLSGAGKVVGFLDHARDIDVYELQLDAPRRLDVELRPPLGGTAKLALTDGQGTEVRASTAGEAGATRALRGFGLGPGTWRLVVSGTDKSYDAKRPYGLDIQLSEPSEAEELEPNELSTDPNVRSLLAGKVAQGWVHPAGDVDTWRVAVGVSDAPDGQITTFRVGAPPGMRLNVHLHGPDGKAVARRESLGGKDATFTQFLTPGIYTVRVGASDAAAADAVQPYEVEVVE